MQERPQRLPADHHRPRYHFTPPAGWMNDPNGLGQWNGTYHLFYQYNPRATVWDHIHWGHATSTDLLTWEDEPIALTPAPGGADSHGCWSGALVNNQGVPTLIYTGYDGTRERPCLAVGDATLTTWTPYHGNPVIPDPPPDLDLLGFRDHTLWREDGRWFMGMGTGIRDRGGAVLLYSSLDLRTWTYHHPLVVGSLSDYEDDIWECPDFFALDGKHVLIVSNIRTEAVIALIGTYAEQRFIPEQRIRVDYGKSLYAPQTFLDEQGRRILIGWLKEERAAEAQAAAGWSGAMSMPRVLHLDDQHRLVTEPVLPSSGDVINIDVSTSARAQAFGETIPAGAVGHFTLRTHQQTIPHPCLTLQDDRGSTVVAVQADGTIRTAEGLLVGEPLTAQHLAIEMFIDGSVVEVTINQQVWYTCRWYLAEQGFWRIALC